MVFKRKVVLDDGTDPIASARYVLGREIEGLQALEQWLGDDFIAVVELLDRITGKVVLSGMGKSGHIARKIAATLASTGCPAIYVHPGEASHGDLGMVGKEDALLLFSNSGETSELQDVINYAKRFSIPLVGIVRRKSSVLVDAANVALVLPEVPEACHVQAPTTSTTMMLALGDALAVALMEQRGFNVQDFKVFHPGGRLGSAFLKVEDLMHAGQAVPVVDEGQKMSEVFLEISGKSFGCTAVVDASGQLKGIITDGDLRRHMSADITSKLAREVMTSGPVTIERQHLASAALALMQEKKITALFVVGSDRKPLGILHIHDLLRRGVA